jgi:tRNA (adenine22-N1)-methyltransferase
MQTIPTLSARLMSALPYLKKGGAVIDVGTDHAYLPIFLVREGISSRALACDINRGPIESAERNIAAAGFACQIDTLCTDGLHATEGFDPDNILIFGMGGELISSIIEQSGWKRFEDKHFILQPMSRAPHLRRWLSQNGFSINEEKACCSAGHYYTVMSVYYTGEIKIIDEYDIYGYIGELGRDSSEEAKIYLNRTLSELEKQRKGASFGNAEREKALAELLEKLRPVIERSKR